MNYKQLANVQGEFTYFLIEFKNSGVYFMVALRSDREFKTFFVHFDLEEISNLVSDKIDFSLLNYTDVTKNISKGDSSSFLLLGCRSFSSFLKVLDPPFN
jgi:3-methyladenine DNA glycosylase Tag